MTVFVLSCFLHLFYFALIAICNEFLIFCVLIPGENMCLYLLSSLLNQFFFCFLLWVTVLPLSPLMIHALSFHSLWLLKELWPLYFFSCHGKQPTGLYKVKSYPFYLRNLIQTFILDYKDKSKNLFYAWLIYTSGI